ncbi:MAG TPA: M1 family metallopeptidase [Candidatus Eisenbacteria bacterium]|nr:M1 family metallopeptidase [Candidatus Eisenbacteria bacterium]
MRRLMLALLVLAAAGAPARALTTDHRLDRTVVPTSEALALDIDPAQQGYAGTATIGLEVASAVDSFQLHARELTIDQLTLRGLKASVPVTFRADSSTLVTVRAAHALAPGAYTLTIRYHNDFDRRATGLYRLQVGDTWYAYTDFEPADARQAWPCFDEPEFKVPWQMTVTIPKGTTAVANMPALSTVATARGKRVTFARTPPLSSYLVELSVGPFDMVPIKGMSVPGHVVAPKGQGRYAAEAARIAPPLLAALEKYFGRPYPFAKLDLIAVPEFWAGAMENAGAITFRADRLLLDPAEATPALHRGLVVTTAHEMAHMWFGDLVTMKWWDDVWLNESFATWMENKVSQQTFPQFRDEDVQGADVQRAYGVDASPYARAMRRKVDALGTFPDLFDPLSYQKGEAVLGMVEHWIGPGPFQRGVRSYITAHAWHNAVGQDLWDALSKVAGADVGAVVASFLEQPGIPLVTVNIAGDGTVSLSQHRYSPDPDRAGEPGRWKIPVTLAWADAAGRHQKTVLLADTTADAGIRLTSDVRWMEPNVDERGYYRWSLPPAMRKALEDSAATSLDARERIGLVFNAGALLQNGGMHGDEYLDVVAGNARDQDALVQTTAVTGLDIARRSLVDDHSRLDFAAWVRRTYGPALEPLGFVPKPNEPAWTMTLRADLWRTVGDLGRDPAALERARTLADAWLEDSTAIDPSLAPTALRLSAQRGDRARWDLYRQRFESATGPGTRTMLLDALGAFRDSALAMASLDYSRQGPLRPQERFVIYRTVNEAPELQDMAFTWLTQNYDAMMRYQPPQMRRGLLFGAGGCSAGRLEKARAFFLAPEHRTPTTDQDWARTEAATKDCMRLHDREAERVARYLQTTAATR